MKENKMVFNNGLIYKKKWFGYYIIKRICDFIFAFLALVLLSPVFLIVAIAIKIDSRGPVFFKQMRIGKNGKSFKMYKFRSMYNDAEKKLADIKKEYNIRDDVMLFKLKNDPRITKVGKFLRAFSIDELPQLLNILIGNMTIVGPRPALYKEYENYTDYQKNRLLVKQGLTCYWQVMGKNNLTFDEQVELDIKYICKRNIFIDFWLIIRTIPVVIFGKSQ